MLADEDRFVAGVVQGLVQAGGEGCVNNYPVKVEDGKVYISLD